MEKPFFELAAFKVTGVLRGMPGKLLWQAACGQRAARTKVGRGCGQNGLLNMDGWGSTLIRVFAWDLDRVTSSRDSRDMLQYG